MGQMATFPRPFDSPARLTRLPPSGQNKLVPKPPKLKRNSIRHFDQIGHPPPVSHVPFVSLIPSRSIPNTIDFASSCSTCLLGASNTSVSSNLVQFGRVQVGRGNKVILNIPRGHFSPCGGCLLCLYAHPLRLAHRELEAETSVLFR